MYKDPLLKAQTSMGGALTLLSMFPIFFFSFNYCVVKHLGYWGEKKKKKEIKKERLRFAREHTQKRIFGSASIINTERRFLSIHIFIFQAKRCAVAFDRLRSLDQRRVFRESTLFLLASRQDLSFIYHIVNECGSVFYVSSSDLKPSIFQARIYSKHDIVSFDITFRHRSTFPLSDYHTFLALKRFKTIIDKPLPSSSSVTRIRKGYKSNALREKSVGRMKKLCFYPTLRYSRSKVLTISTQPKELARIVRVVESVSFYRINFIGR